MFFVLWIKKCIFCHVAAFCEVYIIGGQRTTVVLRLGLTSDGKIDDLSNGPSLPTLVTYASVVADATSTVLILTAGISNGNVDVWILDTKESPSAWLEGPTLLTRRNQHFSFSLGGQVFVGCGVSNGDSLSSVEVMTPTAFRPHWAYVKEDYPIKVNIKETLKQCSLKPKNIPSGNIIKINNNIKAIEKVTCK